MTKPAPASNRVVATDDNELTPAQKIENVYRVHASRLKNRKGEIDRIKDTLKAVQKLYSAERLAFTHDTGIAISQFDLMLKKAELQRGDLVKEAVDWNNICEWEGIPVGGQSTLIAAFENTPADVRDAMDYEGEGWRAYGRGLPCEPPAAVPPRFISEWAKGWQAHQEKVAFAMARTGAPIVTEEADPDEDDSSDRDDE